MIANSNNMIDSILQYKQRYIPIGRIKPFADEQGNGSTRPADDLESLFMKHLGASGGTEAFTKLSKAIDGASDATAEFNLGLSKAIKVLELQKATVVKQVAAMTLFENREASLTKTFKVGTEVLANRTKAYAAIQAAIGATANEMARYRAIAEKNSELDGKRAAKAAGGGATPAAKAQVTQQQMSFDILSRTTTLTDDSQASLELYAAGTGKSLAEQIIGVKGLAKGLTDVVAESTTLNTVHQEIASMGADIRQHYSKTNGALEIAVLKSKQLGLSMEKMHEIGKGLLDIEQSVGNEIDYQLISGNELRDLQGRSLTDRYREATIMGDANKQLEVMNDVLTTQSGILEGTDFYAKEALAKTLQLSTKELMHLHEKKKLQDELNLAYGGALDINKALADPKLLTTIQPQFKVDTADLTTKLADMQQKQTDLLSPAERSARGIEHLVDLTLAEHKMNTAPNRKLARDGAKKTEEILTNPTKGGADINAMLKEPQFIQILGKLQSSAGIKEIFDSTMGLVQAIPAYQIATSAVAESFKAYSELKYGKTIEGSTEKINTGAGGDVMEQKDAVLRINDGLIQFHPKDKITAIVASPYGAMNERVATNALGGNASKNNGSMDVRYGNVLNNIANSVNKYLSVSQTALQSTIVIANKSITKSNDILDKFKISNAIKKDEPTQSINEPNTFIKRPVADADVETKFIKSLVDQETAKFKTNIANDDLIGNIVQTKTITENIPSSVTVPAKTEVKNTDLVVAVTDLIKNMTETNNKQFDPSHIVNSIKNGLKDVHFTVALDPSKVDKEIKFRGGGLNV